MLIVLGLPIVHGSPWFYLVGVPFFVVRLYVASSRAEEDFLRQKFGAEYEEYAAGCIDSSRRSAAFGATLAPMTFNWKKVVRAETARRSPG